VHVVSAVCALITKPISHSLGVRNERAYTS
jgi:hypothetical protein